ncbi:MULTISPECIES: Holliday junction branch migration protein RuvA [unclassified Olsenella]|uniref:Holliday junction branch migration protein RuvA n=1 Tax=Olsenella TaxID=133925 RepID=UPI000231EE15|nr:MULTISPECIES: Holliday junction branch migration protein RuvA [unclassified Olsenella]EHF01579.1 Holliday junction DNA helicase RuvA [Olsenella sp. oral taxon 809 str. F0356]KXB62399.1 Holliday junction DNA helicase RuvA [Olsenella sp. DNF00959]
MISQLTGSLLEALPTRVVLDVGGVGYELGVSATTAASLPAVGEAGVTLLTRLLVKESALELYGFATREERSVFDRLVAVSGVGPKLALAVLSTYSAASLATIVATQDATRMAQVPGVGKKKAQRLLMELQDVFAKDAELRGLVGMSEAPASDVPLPQTSESVRDEAGSALLAMGFTPQEAELALQGLGEAGVTTIEKAVAYALKRLGGAA